MITLSRLVVLLTLSVVAATRGRSADCDQNGIDDLKDVAAGAPDCNSNGSPDACDVLPKLGFREDARFLVGTGPETLLAADIDDDGTFDLVTAGDGVSAFLGMGDGTFAPARNGHAPVAIDSFVAGDFDGDGVVDLVIGGEGQIALLAGHGDGSFEASEAVAITDTGARLGLTAADLNGDGTLDLAAVARGTSDILVLLGNGAGDFVSSGSLAFGAPVVEEPTFGPASADLDGDGAVDLAQAHSGGVSLFFGRGDGTFEAVQSLSTERSYSLAVADLDGDGVLDIAATSRVFIAGGGSDPVVSLFLGKGSRSFRAEESIDDGPSGPSAIAAADFDGDGHIDLATLGHVRFGNGDATFRRRVNLSAGRSIAARDFDRDGAADLATVISSSTDTISPTLDAVLVYPADGDGGFRSPTRLPVRATLDWLAAADVDADGVLDIVTTNQRPGDVAVYLRGEDGSIRTVQRLLLGSPSGGPTPRGLLVADFDDDGVADLATGSPLGLTVFRGVGDGSFREGGVFPLGIPGLGSGVPGDLAAADFDADGNIDVAMSLFFPGAVAVLFGSADGTLGMPRKFDAGELAADIVAVDLDADGNVDLAAGENRAVTVLFGRGDGTFEEARRFSLEAESPGPNALVATDLDADGHKDLVTVTFFNVVVLLGRADRTFEPPRKFRVSEATDTFEVAAADVDRDGRTDIVLLSLFRDSGVTALLGDGDGGFRSTVRLPIHGQTLVAADLDHRGGTDLVVTTSTFELVMIENVTTPPFSSDEDGDGRPDECLGGFVRGDCNHDAAVNIADPVCVLNHLFGGGPAPSCLQTADADDDNVVDIADPVYQLNYLFGGGPALALPVGECGTDPTPAADAKENLSCEAYPPCE